MATIFEGDPFTREGSFAPADAGMTFGDRLSAAARSLNIGPSERVYAGGGTPTVDNPLGAPDAAGAPRDTWGVLVSAAYNQSRLVNSWTGRIESLSDAADKRISTVRDETGMQLENPFRQGYHMEARKRLEDRRRMGEIHSFGLSDVMAEQRAIFNEQVNLAAERFPDKAGKFWFYQPMEDQGKALASSAETAGEQASAAVSNPVARFAGEIIGGIGSMVHDPVQVAGMFAGAGPSVARSMAVRIGQTAAREAMINAGLQALEEPAVQQWRAELGLKSGLVPALENIGMAGLLGGALGGGLAGVRELLNPLRRVNLSAEDTQAMLRVLDGSATPSETLRAIEAAKIEISPELRETLEVARRAEIADREALPHAPAGVDAEAHNSALAQAVRSADDMGVPPPSSPLGALARAGEAAPDLSAHPEAAAILRGIEDGTATPLDAARLLREFPALDNGSLRLHGEEAQGVRGLAALSEDAWRAVNDGRISAEHAAMIGRIAPDRPEAHAGLVSDIAKARPETQLEAAHVIYQGMAATQETQRLMAGANFDLWSSWASLKSEAERLRMELRNETRLADDAARMAAVGEVEAQISTLKGTLSGAKGAKAERLKERLGALEGELATLQQSAPGGAASVVARKDELRARLAEVDASLRDLVEPMAKLRQEAEASRISALRESFKDLGEPGTPQADYAAPAAKPLAEAPAAKPAADAPVSRPAAASDGFEVPPNHGLFDQVSEARADLAKWIESEAARGSRLDFAADIAAACKF